ncbi:MAG: lysophospholipase [Candidatus Omnitrophica bacterium]|nr:lysophospholipase [Candidatus Omnitrophota bacterium]
MNPAENFLKTADGLRLFTRRWEVSNPRPFCLLVHGLGEHSGRYEALAKELNRRGIAVWSMDNRGHGRSEGLRGDCRSINDFVEDLHLLVQEAQRQLPGPPRLLLGHSLGGLIALTYAAQYPQMIRAVAVSSPALRLAHEPPTIKRLLAENLARILPKTPLPNGVNPNFVSRDPEVVAHYKRDPLIHRVISARGAIALRQAMAESPRLASQLRIPILILLAGDDRICDPQAAVEFAASIQATPATLRRYDGLYHEIFNEPERGRVIEDLCGWMEEILR